MAKDADLGRRIRADDLAETDLERETLARLRGVTGVEDGAMERHGLRCFLIGERLAEVHGAPLDRELLLVAALVHDIGLYDDVSSGGVYVTEGREWAEGLLAGREDWDDARTTLCLEAIERHHELREQWAAGVEVELLRRADLVDLTRGLVAFGAGRTWLGALWHAVPRDGIYGEIGALVAKALRERPATLPHILRRGA